MPMRQKLQNPAPTVRKINAITLLLALSSLTACGGGGGSDSSATGSTGTGTNTTNNTNTNTNTNSNTNTTAATFDVTCATAGAGTNFSPSFASMAAASTGIKANMNGAMPFPADNAWNTDISAANVDPNSDNLIASIGKDTNLRPDFGCGLWQGAPIGIPYVVVDSTQVPKLTQAAMDFVAYPDESDAGPYPVPANAPIEGGAEAAVGTDRHVLVIDKGNNTLYELNQAFPQANGSWKAANGAVFNLTSNATRTPGWTSADAAGLPIFPGLARFDEVANGAINHALRFTVPFTRQAYVAPATHRASTNTDVNLPPMGMRVRLKASYVIPNSYDPQTKIIFTALKKYGMFVADHGQPWFITGAPHSGWNSKAILSQIGSLKGSDFEVVEMTNIVTN